MGFQEIPGCLSDATGSQEHIKGSQFHGTAGGSVGSWRGARFQGLSMGSQGHFRMFKGVQGELRSVPRGTQGKSRDTSISHVHVVSRGSPAISWIQ